MEKVLSGVIINMLMNHGAKLTTEDAQVITNFLERLADLSRKIDEQNILLRPVLNFEEACQYLRMSASHLYKLTALKQIPHYCPQGKKLYFRRDEIDKWLMRNRQSAEDEIDSAAIEYIIRNKRGK